MDQFISFGVNKINHWGRSDTVCRTICMELKPMGLVEKWHCCKDCLHGTETNGIYEGVILFVGLHTTVCMERKPMDIPDSAPLELEKASVTWQNLVVVRFIGPNLGALAWECERAVISFQSIYHSGHLIYKTCIEYQTNPTRSSLVMKTNAMFAE